MFFPLKRKNQICSYHRFFVGGETFFRDCFEKNTEKQRIFFWGSAKYQKNRLRCNPSKTQIQLFFCVVVCVGGGNFFSFRQNENRKHWYGPCFPQTPGSYRAELLTISTICCVSNSNIVYQNKFNVNWVLKTFSSCPSVLFCPYENLLSHF